MNGMSRSPAVRRFLGLCVPFLLVMAVDGCVTLAGQPAEYWAGDYGRVNEGSVTFRDLLLAHPAAFVAGLAANGAIVSLLILLLPRLLALMTALTATIGHTWGATTWLAFRFQFSYAQCQLFFCCVALVLSICLTQAWTPDADRPLLADRPLACWSLLMILAVIPIWAFLLR
jgi:hypothetical protein